MLVVLILSTIMLVILVLLMSIPAFLSKKGSKSYNKLSPYECGFDSIKINRLPFSVQFFMIAIIFMIFDVEICLLLPAVVTTGGSSLVMWFILLILFLSVLQMGAVYEWNQGILDWKK